MEATLILHECTGCPGGYTSGVQVAVLHRHGCCNVSTVVSKSLSSQGELESTEAPTPASSDPEDGGLSGGAIAGIVIGTLVGVALVGLLVWIFLLPSRPWLPADHGVRTGMLGKDG